MTEDPFFLQRKPPDEKPPKGLYEIYLAYFDEAYGHMPLFTYPAHLKQDKEECRIISIHSIWWLDTESQQDLEHVDLEYHNRNFLATKFKGKSLREKSRSGLTTETPETFVLIVSVPINLTPFGTNMLATIFNQIQDIKDELYILIEKELACEKPIKTQKDKEIIHKGEELESKLLDICEESIPSVAPDVLDTLINVDNPDQENLAFLLLDDLHVVEPGAREFNVSTADTQVEPPKARDSDVFRQKIEVQNISLMDNDQKLKIVVKNTSNRNLINVIIRITHIQEFFEAASWSTTIDEWYADEELIFQYPRIIAENNDEYMLRVEDSTGKLLVKKISFHDFNRRGGQEV